MRNTKPLRNALLITAVCFALAAVANLLLVHIPNVTAPVNAAAFLLFASVAVLDWRANRKRER